MKERHEVQDQDQDETHCLRLRQDVKQTRRGQDQPSDTSSQGLQASRQHHCGNLQYGDTDDKAKITSAKSFL